MAIWHEQDQQLKSWTTFFDRLSRRMRDDYWEHAAAFGRYVDELARARSVATFEEARRSYRDRVLSLLEQSMQGYARILERPVTERSARPSVAEPAPPLAAPPPESDSVRAKAAADALLNVVRDRAAAEKAKAAAPTKRKRASKPRKRKTPPDNDAAG